MAAQMVQALAAPARLRLRPALHNQAVAFAAGLPPPARVSALRQGVAGTESQRCGAFGRSLRAA